MAMFSVPSTERSITSYQSTTIAFASLLARRLIFILWKAACPPSFIQSILEVMIYLKIEKLRFSLNKSLEKYNRIWFPFIDYLKNLSFLAP